MRREINESQYARLSDSSPSLHICPPLHSVGRKRANFGSLSFAACTTCSTVASVHIREDIRENGKVGVGRSCNAVPSGILALRRSFSPPWENPQFLHEAVRLLARCNCRRWVLALTGILISRDLGMWVLLCGYDATAIIVQITNCIKTLLAKWIRKVTPRALAARPHRPN